MKQEQAEKISTLLQNLLEDNLGNRLTQATATGLLTLFARGLSGIIEQPDSGEEA